MGDPVTQLAPAPAPKRVLPHSIDAERSVVGGILLHPAAFVEAAEFVSDVDFYHPAHVAIFRAMLDLDAAGRPIDELTVAEQLRANDTWSRLRALGFEAYFIELTTSVVTVENIAYHARMVHGKAQVRRLIEAAHEIVAHGYGDYGDVEEFIAESQRRIFAITVEAAGPRSRRRIHDAVVDEFHAIEKRVELAMSPGPIVLADCVTTGIAKLDQRLGGGLHDEELIVVAARPSMGKTSLVMNAVVESAKVGVAWLVISLETPRSILVRRMLSSEARVDGERLRTGVLWNKEDVDSINRNRRIAARTSMLSSATMRLKDLPIWIDDRIGVNVDQIVAAARHWALDPEVQRARKRAVAIDHLQLIDWILRKGEQANENLQLSRITKALAALARTLSCPVVLLSQLNRDLEKRPNKRPQLSDLRGSGSIEQDARCILTIYRDEVYDKDTKDKGVAEVAIAKQNHGKTGLARLRWEGQITRFDDLDEGDDENRPPLNWGAPQEGE